MDSNNYILRLKQVVHATGLSRSSIYLRMKTDFPQSVKLGERAVGWRSIEINDWVISRSKLKVDGAASNEK